MSFFFLLSSCEYDTVCLATRKKKLGCVGSVSGQCTRVLVDDHGIVSGCMLWLVVGSSLC